MQGMEGEMLKGHLDMIVLAALSAAGSAHGYAVIEEIKRRSGGAFDLPEGTIYPALHRLEQRGWVSAKWETAPDRNREFKYYRLTEKGKKQLVVEESQWKQMSEAVARVMWPPVEEI